ncbi:MAG TPA: hypothetical protein VGF45_07615 [Polyangia bacterium]
MGRVAVLGHPHRSALLQWIAAAVLMASCATAPPPPPKGKVFSVPASQLPPGGCRLQITYDGGLEALGDLNAVAIAIDGGKVMEARSKADIDALRTPDGRTVRLGEYSLEAGVHRIDVGFQHLGRWIYQGYVFNITSAETFDCGEGFAKISVKGSAPFKLTAETWSSATAQFAWDGVAKAVPGAVTDPL